MFYTKKNGTAKERIKEQTRQSLTNVRAILEGAGLTMSNVVKTTVFLADMNDFADMNAVYAEFFNHIPLVLPSPLRRYRKAHWLR